MKWHEHPSWGRKQDALLKIAPELHFEHHSEVLKVYDQYGFVIRLVDLHQGLDFARVVESVATQWSKRYAAAI